MIQNHAANHKAQILASLSKPEAVLPYARERAGRTRKFSTRPDPRDCGGVMSAF
jgi:hypothetical protein